MLTPSPFGRSPVQRAAFVGASALGLLLLSAAAHAAEPGPDTLPVAIPAIEGNDAYDQAEALTKALRNAVRTMPGWSLAPGDQSIEVLMLSMKCSDPPDASCQSRVADSIKADRYVWGGLKKKGGNVVGELNLWTRGRGTTKVAVDYSANLTEGNDDTLKKIAIDTLNKLLGGAPKGGLSISAGGLPGQVFVDDQPIGATGASQTTFQIPAGSHKITVKAAGYLDSDNTVTIKPNQNAELSVSLVKDTSDGASNWRKIAGFGALGLGAAFAAGGAVAGLETLSASSDLQKNYAPVYVGQDICTEAEAGRSPDGHRATAAGAKGACDRGKTAQTLQFVFWPAAAVSAGAGIFLLATSGVFSSAPKKTGTTGEKTGLEVQPVVGPGIGAVEAKYTF